jgi:hypothetical protein
MAWKWMAERLRMGVGCTSTTSCIGSARDIGMEGENTTHTRNRLDPFIGCTCEKPRPRERAGLQKIDVGLLAATEDH